MMNPKLLVDVGKGRVGRRAAALTIGAILLAAVVMTSCASMPTQAVLVPVAAVEQADAVAAPARRADSPSEVPSQLRQYIEMPAGVAIGRVESPSEVPPQLRQYIEMPAGVTVGRPDSPSETPSQARQRNSLHARPGAGR